MGCTPGSCRLSSYLTYSALEGKQFSNLVFRKHKSLTGRQDHMLVELLQIHSLQNIHCIVKTNNSMKRQSAYYATFLFKF